MTANDVLGKIQWWANDTSTVTNFIAAEIKALALSTISTDINPGILVFSTTNTSTAGSSALVENLRIQTNGTVSQVGFHGVAPVVRPAAFTQTYSTATRTVPAATAATLTDNTAGTPTTTLEAMAGAVYTTDIPAIRNNFADLAAMVNKLTADDLTIKQAINAILDQLQLYGLEA